MTSKTDGKQDNLSLVTEKNDGRGKHPNSQANLKPFEKGVSGNPDGRPHKYEKFKRALMKFKYEQVDGWQIDCGTNFNKVINNIWYQAGKGSVPHINILAELGCLDDE